MTDRTSLIEASGNKAEAFEAFDDIPANPDPANTIGDVINARFGRRDVLRGALGVTAATALFGAAALAAARPARAASHSGRHDFAELSAGVDTTHHVADGYQTKILLRWGDPLFADAPAFDPLNQTADAQLRQFGYNNDYIGFIELGEGRGLLCINHEYTNEEVMFPGLGRQDKAAFAGMTQAIAEIEMAAHGVSVVEIARHGDGEWAPVLDSSLNRRISPLNTPMTFSGPAAGSPRMKTAADPAGMNVIGTLNNCAGGITPWGTYLTAEENFHGYFWTDTGIDAASREAKSQKRYGVPGRWYNWGQYFDRFNIDAEPNEPNRFGWIVEIDPADPDSTPVKHTALGRFRHEGAETALSPDGHVVIYSGDDARFDYLYKFVSAGRYDEAAGKANSVLLSDGTLYVARFNVDGTVDWLPLIFGTGPLTAEYGFASQADVLIDARIAADLLGATPMDRPEDAQPDGKGKVYVMLTNNSRRQQVSTANPRAENRYGHIIEITEDAGDHAATTGRWDIVVLCGDPEVAPVGARWNPATSADGWFASPDNCALDAQGRLWVSTDQGGNWPATGNADGLYALETRGDGRGTSRLFFRCPVGAELCGPSFTSDGKTLFLAVQHPGTDGTRAFPGFERDSTFEDPATRWPDFDANMPPRPSVLVVTKKGGGKIAG